MGVRQLFRPGIKTFWVLMICYLFLSIVCLHQDRTIQKQRQVIKQLQSDCQTR
jgi:hypothetical protein